MWGITTLGALANLKETELITRLGQQGREMRLLARGESPHLFRAIEAAWRLKSEWNWTRQWSCSIRCFLSWE